MGTIKKGIRLMTFSPRIKKQTPGITNNEPSLTQQSDQKQTDIHYIMKQFERTGVLQHSSQYEGQYGNFADMPNYTLAHQLIAEAKTMFETVPASIRALHNNDPSQFVSWMQNPENRDQMLKQGFTDTHLPALEVKIDEKVPSSSEANFVPSSDQASDSAAGS